MRLGGDSHEGERIPCQDCGVEVELEWDGGFAFELSEKKSK